MPHGSLWVARKPVLVMLSAATVHSRDPGKESAKHVDAG